ncbi:hypothetical protein R5R35_005649 [Gryllus longicercus]|uniref:Phospholipid/glycerol acyltransferase domain-containing protein n=1 Tax=Gryllus longicercus TaxID=2509291 RepID=A0AAN9VF33_9ORTH
MNGKLHADDDLSMGADLLNPFVHRLELSTTYEKIKTGVLTVLVLPVRVAAIFALLTLAWLLACVGLLGVSERQLRERPLAGWRRGARAGCALVVRAVFACGGFWRVRVKGRRAAAAEAPVLALAPHSSFCDALPVVCLGAPSVVAKAETGKLPFFGKLINYTQPVYVWREDPDSRQKTIREIVDRATSPLDWPQVLIFPEGTCTNRSCLITFKPGAFYPGVPVQPVCIRYPNKLDTVTWTWEGPGALKLLWLTLTQVHSSCEIEFLPVYHPDARERADPKLFASNVRRLMARALGVPVSDYTYDDCRLLTRAKRLRLPDAAALVEAQRLRQRIGGAAGAGPGAGAAAEEERLLAQLRALPEHVSLAQFAQLLGARADDSQLQQLFHLYDKQGDGRLALRDYLFDSLLVARRCGSPQEALQLAFQVFDRSGEGDGRLAPPDAREALRRALPAAPAHALRRAAPDGAPLAISALSAALEREPELWAALGVGRRRRRRGSAGRLAPAH